jgi:hypothetical protein
VTNGNGKPTALRLNWRGWATGEAPDLSRRSFGEDGRVKSLLAEPFYTVLKKQSQTNRIWSEASTCIFLIYAKSIAGNHVTLSFMVFHEICGLDHAD